MPRTSKSLILGLILAIGFWHVESASAAEYVASCHYELYTPAHFENPVVTQEFKLDLSRTEFTNTEDPAIKRIIRLQSQPTSMDGKSMTHFGFSLTYDGAHTGAVIPMSEGVHLIQVGRDGSDLIGAYLFCNVSRAGAPRVQIFSAVHCKNLNLDHRYSELYFRQKRGRRFAAEFVRRDEGGKAIREPLEDVEFYEFADNQVKLAGADVVAEFVNLGVAAGAQPARVAFNKPYYESNRWVCKPQE